MRAIRIAMRRYLAVSALLSFKDTLLRLCRKQAPIQPSAPTTRVKQQIELYVEAEDPEDQFAAWEAERDDRLHQAEEFEGQGLQLLGKAALLRTAIRCEDRGETFIAQELREHAQALGSEPITEVPGDTLDEQTLRLVTDNAPACGAEESSEWRAPAGGPAHA